MSIPISVPLKSLRVNGIQAYATLWIIETTTGSTLRLTDHDQPIYFAPDGETDLLFEPNGAISATAHERDASLAENNFDARGVLSSEKITDEDLRAGLYNEARVTEYIVDWRAPWAGAYSSDVWYIESVSFDGESWQARLSSKKADLRRKVGRVFTRTCGWNLGEFNATTGIGCHYDLLANRQAFTVHSSITERLVIETDLLASVDTTGKLFENGFVEWITPSKFLGFRSPVKIQTNNTRIRLTFFGKLPFVPVPSVSSGWLYPGCEKTVSRCKALGQFPARFGGFNTIPGTDKSLETPNAKK